MSTRPHEPFDAEEARAAQAYASLPAHAPSAALDARILANARAAVASQAPRRRPWFLGAGLGTAAAAVFAAGIAWQLGVFRGDQAISPAPVQQPAVQDEVERIDIEFMKQEKDQRAREEDKERAPVVLDAPAPVATSAPPPPPAAPMQEAAPAAKPAPVPEAAADRGFAEAPADAAPQAAAAAADAESRDDASERRDAAAAQPFEDLAGAREAPASAERTPRREPATGRLLREQSERQRAATLGAAANGDGKLDDAQPAAPQAPTESEVLQSRSDTDAGTSSSTTASATRAPTSDAPAPAGNAPVSPPMDTATDVRQSAAPATTGNAASPPPAANAATAGTPSVSPAPAATSSVAGGFGLAKSPTLPAWEADAQLAPAAWLDRIQARVQAGDVAGARASLRRFVREHPSHRVPRELQRLLEE